MRGVVGKVYFQEVRLSGVADVGGDEERAGAGFGEDQGLGLVKYAKESLIRCRTQGRTGEDLFLWMPPTRAGWMLKSSSSQLMMVQSSVIPSSFGMAFPSQSG